MPHFRVSLTLYLGASTENEANTAAWEAAKSARGNPMVVGAGPPAEVSPESVASLKRLREIIANSPKADISHPIFPDRPGETKIRFTPRSSDALDSLIFDEMTDGLE